MLMAEAAARRDSIEMNKITIGNKKQYEIDYSSSESASDRDETEDIIGPLAEQGLGEKGVKRERTRTCNSTCSCSGTPLWQPSDDPTEINMLDVP